MQPDDICGRYKIIKELGSGAFGTVYLAIATHESDQHVVIKHLDPKGLSSPEQVKKAEELFRQEKEILKRLGDTCKCIPEVYDFFEEKGSICIVQEFIPGTDLTDKVKSGIPLSKNATVEMIRSILTPLQCVHWANIIHRDLKPANIRIREKDGKLFLIDFGIAKKIQTQFSNNVANIGTPGYMSPEQRHYQAKLTVASDIYAVGIIGLFAITGLDPQKDELPQDPHTGKIIASKVNATPELIKFLDGALVHDLNKRYKNATIALDALNSLDNPTPPSNSKINTVPASPEPHSPLPNSRVNTIPASPNPNSQPIKNNQHLWIALGLITCVLGILGFILYSKEKWEEYSIAGHHMRLERPADWKVVTNENDSVNPEDIAIIYPSGQSDLKCSDSVVINIKSQNLPTTIGEYKRDKIDSIKKQYPEVKDLFDETTTGTRISSIPALRLKYKFTDPLCGIQEGITTGTIAQNQGKLYSVIYQASPNTFENNLARVNRIIDSVKID
jgi:eukaryotic-like serine/threonine-protein kinase